MTKTQNCDQFYADTKINILLFQVYNKLKKKKFLF